MTEARAAGTAQARSAGGPARTVAVRQRITLPLWGSEGAVHPQLYSFDALCDGGEHVALRWPVPPGAIPLVRLHSECLTGDVLGSARCDCGPQLAEAIDLIQRQGGALLYLRQEGRGIGLYNKIDAYALQEQGLDTVDANLRLNLPVDARRYDAAGEMLHALGLTRIRLLTNNPEKVDGLRACGIDVVERVPTTSYVSADNVNYLRTKVLRLGHRIDRFEPARVGATDQPDGPARVNGTPRAADG